MADYKLSLKKGATSSILQIFIKDSSVTTGVGLTGLAFNTGSLVAYYHRDTDTTATAISLITMTVGTFASGGFKEIDATNMPGYYQLCIPDASVSSGNLGSVILLKGAANMQPYAIEISYLGYDQTTVPTANVIQIDGNATTSNLATLNLKKLNIVNNAGDAVVASSTGSNGSGINASGNGSGLGIIGTGGTTGSGLVGIGGNTSGSGIVGQATTSGVGLQVLGAGSNQPGLNAAGGTNANGIQTTGAGTGSGFTAIAGLTGNGIVGLGGATSGAGMIVTAVGSGLGLSAIGVGTSSIGAGQGISGPLDTSERNAIADALLKRDMSSVTGEASRSPLNCFRAIRNKVSNNGTTQTITKEDNTTPAWTSTITTNATAPPITSFTGN